MELAASHKMSQPSFSRHIHVLEEAGLILRRVEGTRRPCRLAPNGLAALEQWMALMRRALEANYGRLDGVLAAMGAEAKGNDNDQDDT